MLHSYAPAYILRAPLAAFHAHDGFQLIPSTKEASVLHLFQLSNRGGIHQLDCSLSPPGLQDVDPDHAPSFHWTSDLKKLDKKYRKETQTDDGPLGRRNAHNVDLNEMYRSLFVTKEGSASSSGSNLLLEEEDADEVFDTMEKMEMFWQDMDVPAEHVLTRSISPSRPCLSVWHC